MVEQTALRKNMVLHKKENCLFQFLKRIEVGIFLHEKNYTFQPFFDIIGQSKREKGVRQQCRSKKN